MKSHSNQKRVYSYTYNQCTPPAAKLQIIEVIKWWIKWRKVIETGCNPYPNSAPFSSTQPFYFFQAIKFDSYAKATAGKYPVSHLPPAQTS